MNTVEKVWSTILNLMHQSLQYKRTFGPSPSRVSREKLLINNVVVSLVQSNIDAVDGIVLFGSYLTNFLMDTDNKFGVPALTLVGTLDGLTLSYVYRYITPHAQQGGVIQHFFWQFSKTYTLLPIRYIYRSSIPNTRQDRLRARQSFNFKINISLGNFEIPSFYYKEQSPRRKFEFKF